MNKAEHMRGGEVGGQAGCVVTGPSSSSVAVLRAVAPLVLVSWAGATCSLAASAAEGHLFALVIGADAPVPGPAASASRNQPAVELAAAGPVAGRSAKRFWETLQVHAGVTARQGHRLVLLTAERVLLGPQRTPTPERVAAELKTMTRDLRPEDTLLVYFCGHATLHDGRQWLLACRERAEGPSTTGPSTTGAWISLDWLRDEVGRAGAGRKVMILDCCHSGPLGEAERGQFTSREIQLLAACGGDQKAAIWRSRNQSLFTYWLCQGLRGAADGNRNGRLSWRELFRFAQSQVRASLPVVEAEILGTAPGDVLEQMPQLVASGAAATAEDALTLSPMTFEQSMSALADFVHDMLQLRAEPNQTKVAVGEFLEVVQGRETLRGDHPLLGKLSADRLTQELRGRCNDHYTVYRPAQVAQFLLDVDVRARHRPESWRDSRADLFVDTTFVVEVDRQWAQLAASLFDCHSGDRLATTSHRIYLGSELQPVLEREDVVREARLRPAGGREREPELPPRVPASPPPEELPTPRLALQLWRSEDAGPQLLSPHPQQGRPTVQLREGDRLSIHVHNGGQTPMAYVLNVDGVNAYNKVEGLSPKEAVNRNLWFLLLPGETAVHRGWLTSLEKADEFKQEAFEVVPAERAVAQDRFGRSFGEVHLTGWIARRVEGRVARSGRVGIGAGAAEVVQLPLAANWAVETSSGYETRVVAYVREP